MSDFVQIVLTIIVGSVLNLPSDFQKLLFCTEYGCFHIFMCLKFYFPLHSFLLFHSTLLIPFSLIPGLTSCIHEIRDLPFLILPDGHHSNIFWSSFSSFILYTWPYHVVKYRYNKIVYYKQGNMNAVIFSMLPFLR